MSIADAIEKGKKVKFVVLDIHGVLTDNTLYYTQEGTKSESFSLHDVFGIKALMNSGIGVSFLTSKVGRDVEQVAKIYGVPPEMLWGSSAKMARLTEFQNASGYTDADLCYVGDEMIDLGVMKRVAFSVAPADGSEEAKAVSDYVTAAGGGKGVVRELAEFILKAQGKWDKYIEQFQ